ncbi:MAG: aminopeptidase [Candidatus Paceibacterota bacterium]|jgi:aminopeptidase
MPYQLSKIILEKYAKVLVNFALGNGVGVKHGDVVRLTAFESGKPLYMELRKAILRSGAHIISNYLPEEDVLYNPDRVFYEHAQDHQLKHIPAKYFKGLVDEIDHSIFILSTSNPKALAGVDPQKMLARSVAMKPYRKWLEEKENKGNFTWTLALYPTEAMAQEAGITLKEYWKQVIKACFLDYPDPVKKWKEVFKSIDVCKAKLDKLHIKKVHVQGPDVDLWISLGQNRKWLGGGGNNIPSFEIFTSPDWRGTEGWITFNQPLYYQGNKITGIKLFFEKGRVIKATAKTNARFLKQIMTVENADKVGEFSLTDKNFSRINTFLAETLYDENMGGKNGNTHIAIGNAYKEGLAGDMKKMTQKKWNDLGFNESPLHIDIISTSPRTVTAHLADGKEKVIYKDGTFTL